MEMTIVTQLLQAPLSDVVSEAITVRGEAGVVAQWNVPEEGSLALVRYGLPSIEGKLFQPDVQRSPEPEIHAQGAALYRLGDLGQHYVVGSLECSSAVLVHSDERGRRGGTFNSSLGLFVDAIWRWSRLLPILDLAEDESVYDALDLFIDRIREADPLAATAESWMWPHLVDGW